MNWYEWRDSSTTKADWLTLGWLRGLDMGETVDLCVLDRNTADCVERAHAPDAPVPAHAFFETQRVVFTKTAPYAGTFEHVDCNVVKHGAPFDIEVRSAVCPFDGARMEPGFEWSFYPVTNQSNNTWDALQDSVWIGWRGPALLWAALYNQPCLQWT